MITILVFIHFHYVVFCAFYSLQPTVLWVHHHRLQHGKNYYTAVNSGFMITSVISWSSVHWTLIWSNKPMWQSVSVVVVSASVSRPSTCESCMTSWPGTTESWALWRVKRFRWGDKHGPVTFLPGTTNVIFVLLEIVQRLLVVIWY